MNINLEMIFLKIPILYKVGYSSDMKKYISGSNSNIIHTHGLWMLANIYRNSSATFVISPHMVCLQKKCFENFHPKKKEKCLISLFQKKSFG